MVQHLDTFAVLDDSSLLIDCGYLIAKIGLDGGNVCNLENSSASAIARGQEDRTGEEECDCRRSRERCGEELHWIELLL
jgi:hypothetical protein